MMHTLGRRALRRPILAETVAIAIICTIDLAHTIFFVASGRAVEANPLLAPVIAQSWLSFAFVKATSFLIPLLILEALRPLSPRFIKLALRAGAIAYMSVYALAFI